MNGIIKKIFAVLLAVITASLVSVQALGASANKKYISEVVVCYASSAQEAETTLKSKGYELAADTDLNSTLSKGVYLGYKTTSKKSEAVTDLALMNMKGKYSYSDYETLLKNNREQVDSWISDLISVIKEYRANYKDGIDRTVQVHDFLNKITEDVSGKPMGDYLLECSIDGGKHDELTDVFMKGNSSLISCIEQALVLSCDTEDTTWITRMSGTSYDKLEQRYLTAYKTANKAEKAMDTDFGDKAAAILASWDEIYNVLQSVEANAEEENDVVTYTIPEAEGAKEDETGAVEAYSELDALNNIVIYDKLSETEFDDSTLLEFFNRPASEVEPYELYPMCASLSEGQAAQITMTGLRQLFLSAVADNQSAGKSDIDDLKKYIAGMDEISVYDGVDLEIFEKGVALTSEASERESSSTDHWYNAFLNPYHNTSRWGAYVMFYVLPTVVMVAVFGTMVYIGLSMNKAHTALKLAAENAVVTPSSAAEKSCKLIFNDLYVTQSTKGKFTTIFNNMVRPVRGEAAVVSFFKAASFILVLIFLVVDIYMLVDTIIASVKDPDYETVPHHILDATDARGSVDYVMYKAASAVSGPAADLNAYESQNGWLVLYYTRDTEAGEPVLADVTVKTGKNSTPSGYSNLHMFGSRDAGNVTDKAFTDKSDGKGGTYIFFRRDAAAPLASTVATNGTVIILVCAALALGIVLGAVTGKKSAKKPKTKAAV